MNRTSAWKEHAALLDAKGGGMNVPPLRVPVTIRPAARAGAAISRTGAVPEAVPGEWRERIKKASSRHGVEEALLAAVVKAESNFNPDAVSPKGARGVMQIMPATGKSLGLQNFFDPDENLEAGAAYLAGLLREFSHPELALAAYNAGPGAVRRHSGLPPYTETRGYVARVLELFKQYSSQ